jgi:hypothetical protein
MNRIEIPGSDVACESLDVRDGLTVGDIPVLGTGVIASNRLTVDVASVAVPPIYSVLMTQAITCGAAALFLKIEFSAAARRVFGPATAVAINFRFRLDGLLIAPGGGTTINVLPFQIQSASYMNRLPITPGLHTVAVEWSGFGLGFGTMVIDPVALPDLNHAQLVLTEQLN